MLLFRTVPPPVLPAGEFLEVSLVALPSPSAQPSGSTASELSATEYDKKAIANHASPGSEPAPRGDPVVPDKAQSKKHGRALQQTQEPALSASKNGDADSSAQVADQGKDLAASLGHGGEVAGNGSLPVPYGTPINPWPVYPEIARQRGQEGQVALLVNVDSHGNAANVSIDLSSGHSLLDQAALKAIQSWKFNPAFRNGEAVPGTVRVPVLFRLQ